MKMMKKKGILATVLAMILVLGSMTVSAWAEGTTVTDETGLRNALQSGGAIKLESHITLTQTANLTVSNETTIDLNGYKINLGENASSVKLVVEATNGKLTIKDSRPASSTAEGGQINCPVENNGTLTLNAGTLWKGLTNNGTFNMKGGAVGNPNGTVIENKDNATMYADGGEVKFNNQDDKSDNYGKIKVTEGCTPTVFKSDVNNLGSGEISGGTYDRQVKQTSADAVISGGTFNQNNYSGVSASAGKITGGTFYSSVSTNSAGATAEVSGGIFYGNIYFDYTNNKVKDSAYSVIYNTNDASTATPDRVIRGQRTIKPTTDPKKVGYVFKGWYKDNTLAEEFSFGEPVIGDAITVYAGWDTCYHVDSIDQPTCTKSATCTVCGGTIEKLGHSFVKKGNVWKCVREGCNEERSIADGPIIEIKGSDKIFNNLDYTFSFDVPANYTFAGVGYNFEKSGGGLIPLEKGNTYTATVEKKYYAEGEKSFNVFATVQDKEHGDYFTEYKDVQLLEQKGESPKTGDNSNMFLWLALLLVGGGAFTATTLASKRG